MKRTQFFAFITLTALLSQSYAAGGARVFRLFVEAVQTGRRLVIPGVSEATGKRLVENFDNTRKALGLSENATMEEWGVRINALDTDDATKVRLLSVLNTREMSKANADEFLSSMEDVAPGLIRSYYAMKRGTRELEFFPCVSCTEGTNKTTLASLTHPESKRLAGRVNLSSESSLNSDLTRLLRKRGIELDRRALHTASFGRKAETAFVLTVAESASDENLRGLANSIVNLRRAASEEAKVNYFDVEGHFASFLYQGEVSDDLRRVLDDTTGNIDQQGLSGAFEASLMKHTSGEADQIDEAVEACTRRA